MRQAIEILRRRKWLFLIPFPIVFVVPVVFSFIFLRSYKADSTIWLDSNSSVSSVLQQHGAGSSSDTPIQTRRTRLRQLMQTGVRLAVIGKTQLQSRMDTARGRAKTIDYVRKNTSIEVVGPNAVRVTFLGRSPDEAVAVAKSTTSEFVDRVKTAVRQQSEKTTDLFAQQSDRTAAARGRE